MAIVVDTYELTRHFPFEERFGLTAQMRRSAVSIPANIAEGHGRVHRKEYIHHLSIAHGSLWELETLLLLAAELDVASSTAITPLLERTRQIGRMLGSLIRVLRSKATKPTSGPRTRSSSLTPDP